MSDIFDEIDQALHQEKLEKWWKDNGKMVLWFCFCLVFFTAVITFGRQWMETNRAEETARLIELIESGGSAQLSASDIQIPEGATPEEISKILNEKAASMPSQADQLVTFADDAPDGLATIALFRAAQIEYDKGAREKAYSILQSVHDNSAIDDLYRDYALVTLALKKADDETADYKAAADNLKDLAEDDNPWQASALEVQAVLYTKAGDIAAAKQALVALLENKNSTLVRHERAKKFLHVLSEKYGDTAATQPAAE